MHAKVLQRLGTMPISRFMHGYWGRRPLLIRNALVGFRSPVTRAELFDLAARDDVESRLVTSFDGQWNLQHGPFGRRGLPSSRTGDWTLLVQGVDLHLAPAHALLSRFRFVADARLDDLMASYATRGGGVGPHVDSYDVFLLQAQGRRRWRISRQRDQRIVANLPLKILRDFQPTHDWVLEPGDMLYLPPGVAHEGVALDECITLSIGFRAPAWQELVEPWFAQLAEQTRLRGRYADAGSRGTRRPGQLPAALLQQTQRQLMRLRPPADCARRLLLGTLTEPKPQVVFEPPSPPMTRAQFAHRLRARHATVRPDRRTRMSYSGRLLGINGEVHTRLPNDGALIELADRRRLSTAGLRDPRLLDLLHEWYVAGWLHCGNAEPNDP